MLICQYVCHCCRPGSIRADAFRGRGLSLLEKTTLRGLRTRAIPAGVTALPHPDWESYLRKNSLALYSTKELCYWQTLYQRPVYTKTPAGAKASMRPRSAKHEEAH